MKKKILHIIEWIFAIIGLIISVVMIASGEIISGLVFLISALVVSPVFEKIPLLTDKPKKRTVLQFVSSFIIFLIACFLAPANSDSENNSTSDISVASTTTATNTTGETTAKTTIPVTTSSVFKTTTTSVTTSTTTSTTSLTTSITSTETTVTSATTAITTKISDETTTANVDISPEIFVNAVEEAIHGTVDSSNERITNVDFTDGTLTISVDLSEADTTIVSLEDLAVVRAQSITDYFLELEEYEDLWNEVIIDFGALGRVKKSKSDIIESSYGRYFDITEIEK